MVLPTPTPQNGALAETVTVDKDALQKVLDYLTLRPYGEVHVLISTLAQSIQRQAMMKKMQETNTAAAVQEQVAAPIEPEEVPKKRGRRLSKTSP